VDSLSAGAGAGIAIAVIIGLVLVLAGLYFVMRKRRQQHLRRKGSARSLAFEKLEAGSPVPEPERVYMPAPGPRRNSSFGHMGPPSSYTYNYNVGDHSPMQAAPTPSESHSPTPGSSRENYDSSEGSSSVHYSNVSFISCPL
jgi:LPXTG-motif cell wall-anchored protein